MFAEALVCLALNIYHEARDQPFIGQVAVAQVVMNRVDDDRYPDDVCAVVMQGPTYSWKPNFPVRHRCQFSWYCDGKSDNPQDQDRWAEAQMIAWGIIKFDKYRGITEGATHYHATYVSPRWAKTLQLVGRIGAHIFYRWE
jgi:spore germination cell wall hydrolase CwlJ-like protein